MNLDTNIALGVRPPPIDFNAMNQGNVLAQLAQLKNADNQNALAQYQLSSAKRGDESQTALNEAYKGAVDPTSGKVDYTKLYASLASGGAAQHIPKVVEQQNAQRKADLDEAVHRAKLVIDTTAAYRDMVGGINSKDEAIKWLQMQLNDPNMAGSPLTKQGIIEGAKKIPDDPAGLAQWKNQTALGMQKYIELSKAHFIDRGNETQAVSSLTGLPLGGVPSYAKAPTPGDVMTDTRSRQQFGQTHGLAERKFKWEQANQGKQYVEGPDGTGFGYDNKNNTMTLVMNAPAAGSNAMAPAAGPSTNALAAPAPAPSAAPVAQPPAAAGGSGPMGITLPANAPAGVNAPGTPFVGKGASKPIPDNINLAILKNDQNIKGLQNTINLLAKYPDAVGVKGNLPQDVLNRTDPKGVDARAGIADVGSLVMHDRSGAAVTASESPRLMPFIPSIKDDVGTANKKLKRMLQIAKDDQLGLTQTYSKEQGYAVNPIARQLNSSNQAGDIHSQADAVLRENQ